MADVKPYYSDKGLAAAFYDVVTARDRGILGDIEGYAGLVPSSGSVLELGCGTGRVSFALAEKGFSVLGIDLSPAMLAHAQARLAHSSADIASRLRFQRNDIAALNLDEIFDTVICPYYTLSHLPAGAAWRNVFAGVASHLKSGGVAAFHLPDPIALSRPPPAPPEVPVLQEHLDGGRTLRLYIRERRSKPEFGRHDQTVEYQIEDSRGRVERRSRERLTLYVADPRPFAESVGLSIVKSDIKTAGGENIIVFKKN